MRRGGTALALLVWVGLAATSCVAPSLEDRSRQVEPDAGILVAYLGVAPSS